MSATYNISALFCKNRLVTSTDWQGKVLVPPVTEIPSLNMPAYDPKRCQNVQFEQQSILPIQLPKVYAVVCHHQSSILIAFGQFNISASCDDV